MSYPGLKITVLMLKRWRNVMKFFWETLCLRRFDLNQLYLITWEVINIL